MIHDRLEDYGVGGVVRAREAGSRDRGRRTQDDVVCGLLSAWEGQNKPRGGRKDRYEGTNQALG